MKIVKALKAKMAQHIAVAVAVVHAEKVSHQARALMKMASSRSLKSVNLVTAMIVAIATIVDLATIATAMIVVIVTIVETVVIAIAILPAVAEPLLLNQSSWLVAKLWIARCWYARLVTALRSQCLKTKSWWSTTSTVIATSLMSVTSISVAFKTFCRRWKQHSLISARVVTRFSTQAK